MHKREVTERDFRRPEFLDAKVEDYEFRDDGEVVRKDRWEQAVQSIRQLVGVNGRTFEIPEVVDAVRQLVTRPKGWTDVVDGLPSKDVRVTVRLSDGSILKDAACLGAKNEWAWGGGFVPYPVLEWCAQPELPRDVS